MNLTSLSIQVRKFVTFGIVFIIGYLVIRMGVIPAGRAVMAVMFPPKDPPTPIYGLLPPPEFAQVKTLNDNPRYILNTKDGKLPGFPVKMPVYRYRTLPFSYEAGKKATQDAAYLGFLDSDLTTNLRGEIYKWTNNKA